MRTLTKAIFGMAMLAGSALAIATPANAQSNFGFYYGNGSPSYGNPAAYAYGNRGGFWRWDPYLHRRVWIPVRSFYRGRFDRDHDRDDRGWDRGYRGR